ncbi:uncharacterized protein PGTG_05246 [Puccinia graminis f. sp. tritici CRL 75-36-700-3]|uniref:Uncharacterized protein n=1 Tax=Puccinia graminis f. sp. tritici (strain CRL 75-36-700-3 / race SCCL) TaxID=418459 RepID=E3K6L5_PUCGT|nr:uncharacterized protein PGTG_05246 [Puccinia graminis f. sp. tritici CRL 75-36-700-3]EFP80021.2 hypothetical protein PGTG_05246 [Puccinia graminis f. sp. tritici CRL 75-36-700-3]
MGCTDQMECSGVDTPIRKSWRDDVSLRRNQQYQSNPQETIAITTTMADEIYIPGLTNPSLFQELPSLNGFQRLVPQDLAHQIYKEQLDQHSRSSSSSSSAAQLAESCSWRALAMLSRQQIIGLDPSHTGSILQAWSYRFLALYQLRQPRLIAREMLGLFSTIGQTLPLTEILLDLSPATVACSAQNTALPNPKKALPDIIPFSILVLRARLPVLLAPHQHLPVIKTSDGLFELLEGCKRMIDYYDHYSQDSEEKRSQKELWRMRIKEIMGLLASLFAGHGFQPDGISDGTRGGGRVYVPDRLISLGLVQSLAKEDEGEVGGEAQKWVEMETKLWLELGALDRADKLLEKLEPTHPLSLVRAIFAGQFVDVPARFLPLAQASLANEDPPDFNLLNNLAIALLYSGNLSQGFSIMQALMEKLTPIPGVPAIDDDSEGAKEAVHQRPQSRDQWLRANGPMNGMILNYATWIELASGSDSERIKRDFLIRLLQSYPSSSEATKNQSQIEFPIHRIADLVSLSCFKFPASYFQSTP